MPKAYKGSDFERTICRTLSKWWTNDIGDEPRDDVFWRSSQSGGRATQRFKKGLSTFGSFGDLTAVDPIGGPLIKFFTIELKRGSSYGTLGDLFDAAETSCQRPFEACLEQAIRSHKEAGSVGWLLITRRDRRIPIAYFEPKVLQCLDDWKRIVFTAPSILFKVSINDSRGRAIPIKVACLPLEVFLARVTREQIIECLEYAEKET